MQHISLLVQLKFGMTDSMSHSYDSSDTNISSMASVLPYTSTSDPMIQWLYAAWRFGVANCQSSSLWIFQSGAAAYGVEGDSNGECCVWFWKGFKCWLLCVEMKEIWMGPYVCGTQGSISPCLYGDVTYTRISIKTLSFHHFVNVLGVWNKKTLKEYYIIFLMLIVN